MIDDSFGWVLPSRQPVLEAGDVHVWRVSLHTASAPAQKLHRLLADDEVNRAQRFYFSRDRDNFVVVRGLLRVLLGAYLQIPPQAIKFQYGAGGKPLLASDQTHVALDFNLSHSRELALLAFTYNQAIGIDLEYVQPEIVWEQIAERFFSPQEIASLRALPDNLQPAAFFNCWTRKEAFIKATGEGLSRPLDQFSMSLVPDEAARLLTIQGKPDELSKWFVQDLQPRPGYAAAIVVRNPVKQVYRWEYPLVGSTPNS